MEAFLFYIKVSNGLVCAEMKISEVLILKDEIRRVTKFPIISSGRSLTE